MEHHRPSCKRIKHNTLGHRSSKGNTLHDLKRFLFKWCGRSKINHKLSSKKKSLFIHAWTKFDSFFTSWQEKSLRCFILLIISLDVTGGFGGFFCLLFTALLLNLLNFSTYSGVYLYDVLWNVVFTLFGIVKGSQRWETANYEAILLWKQQFWDGCHLLNVFCLFYCFIWYFIVKQFVHNCALKGSIQM